MLTPVPPSECDRARESVSGRLDGELSELEGAWLDAHLRDCAECSAWAREAAALALELRAAPLERPGTLVAPAAAPGRHRRAVALAGTAAAAVVALAAAGVGVQRALQPTAAPVVAGAPDSVASLHQDSLRQHLLALLGPASGLTGKLLVI